MRQCALVLGFVVFAASLAISAVDVEVDLVLSVAGTIAPAGEVDSFRFAASKGTLLNFSLSAKNAPGLDLDVALAGPGGDITLGGFSGFTDSGLKIALRSFPLPESGSYSLRISGQGTGEYALKLKGAAAKSFADQAFAVPASGTGIFRFAAPLGSTVSLEVKPAAGSTAEPRFGKIWDDTDISTRGTFSAKGHKVSLSGVGSGGDLFVEVKNLSAIDGTFAVKASVKAPKPASRKIDCRGPALGLPQGGETLVSRMIPAATGGVITVDDPTSTIHGAAVAIPPAALAGTTDISVASSDDADLPEGTQVAGPAVRFGPPGTTFGVPVVVTLPYDPAGLPPDTEDGDIEVLIEEQNGAVLRISPDVIDPVTGVVTVAVDGFSTFQVIVPKGPPALAGRRYWFFSTEAEVRPGWYANAEIGWQAGDRYYSVGLGEATFGARGQPGGISLTQDFREWKVGHTDNWQAYHDWNGTFPLTPQFDGVFSYGTQSEPASGSWDYGGGGQRVPLDLGGGDIPSLWLGSDGRFLVNGPGSDDSGELTLLVEKPAAAPTPAALAGTWWIVGQGVEASSMGSGNPPQMSLERTFGTIAFRSDGTFSVSDSFRDTSFNGSGITSESGSVPGTGTYAVHGDGSVLLTMPQGGGDPDSHTLLLPDSSLGFMVGTDQDGASDEAFVLFLVRQSSSLAAVSDAPYRTFTVELDLRTYGLAFHRPKPGGGDRDQQAILVGDWELWRDSADLSIDVAGKQFVLSDAEGASVYYAPSVTGGVQVDAESVPGPQTYGFSIGKGAQITIEGSVGAFTPDGALGILVSDPQSSEVGNGITLLLRLPPAKAKTAR